jgi:16S rRNA (uracil1498-N3)-methyltransferase
MHLAKTEKESFYLESVFLSDVELYYSSFPIVDDLIHLVDEECHHIKNVMRHKEGDIIYVTDGKGTIYNSLIEKIEKKEIVCQIISKRPYENSLANICFCIPRLKSADRFEFALEKCVELGITNFIVFESQRTIAKGEKLERWEKILLAAMKQSLRAWLPKIYFVKNVSEIMKMEGNKIIFDQNAELAFADFITSQFKTMRSALSILIFGPEGGFSKEESKVLSIENKVRLIGNRLRSETAIITAASVLGQTYSVQ